MLSLCPVAPCCALLSPVMSEEETKPLYATACRSATAKQRSEDVDHVSGFYLFFLRFHHLLCFDCDTDVACVCFLFLSLSLDNSQRTQWLPLHATSSAPYLDGGEARHYAGWGSGLGPK
jgi:hypothetical protein